MEQPHVPKLELLSRKEGMSSPSVPRRPGMEREDTSSTPVEEKIIRVFTERVTEAEAKAVLEAYFDQLLDQMRVNDQRGAFDTSLEIFKIKQRAEEGEHAEFMERFTKANLADYTDTKRKFTKMVEFYLAEILDKDVLIEQKGLLERALERFFSRQ